MLESKYKNSPPCPRSCKPTRDSGPACPSSCPPAWKRQEYQGQSFRLPCLEELSINASNLQVDLALAPALTSLQLKEFCDLENVTGVASSSRLVSLSFDDLTETRLRPLLLEVAAMLLGAPPSLQIFCCPSTCPEAAAYPNSWRAPSPPFRS